MGVTIHYKGWVASEEKLDKIIKTFKEQAKKDDFPYLIINQTQENSPEAMKFNIFEGFTPERVKGIIFSVNNTCESINFVFGLHNGRWFLRNFTKTFGESPAHHIVLEELGKLKFLVDHLEVMDPNREWLVPI